MSQQNVVRFGGVEVTLDTLVNTTADILDSLADGKNVKANCEDVEFVKLVDADASEEGMERLRQKQGLLLADVERRAKDLLNMVGRLCAVTSSMEVMAELLENEGEKIIPLPAPTTPPVDKGEKKTTKNKDKAAPTATAAQTAVETQPVKGFDVGATLAKIEAIKDVVSLDAATFGKLASALNVDIVVSGKGAKMKTAGAIWAKIKERRDGKDTPPVKTTASQTATIEVASVNAGETTIHHWAGASEEMVQSAYAEHIKGKAGKPAKNVNAMRDRLIKDGVALPNGGKVKTEVEKKTVTASAPQTATPAPAKTGTPVKSAVENKWNVSGTFYEIPRNSKGQNMTPGEIIRLARALESAGYSA